MIATPRPGTEAWAVLAAIVAAPGEVAIKAIQIEGDSITDELSPTYGTPKRVRYLVDQLQRLGLVDLRAVRCFPHARRDRTAGLSAQVLDALAEGPLPLGELARRLGRRKRNGAPDGGLARELQDLYARGFVAPPAALWPTEAGRELVLGEEQDPAAGASEAGRRVRERVVSAAPGPVPGDPPRPAGPLRGGTRGHRGAAGPVPGAPTPGQAPALSSPRRARGAR